ncbi:hypothetical protein OLZ31_26385 [Enterobacter asburiae]|nr:hypothetical protein [Enterobacter asburiae]
MPFMVTGSMTQGNKIIRLNIILCPEMHATCTPGRNTGVSFALMSGTIFTFSGRYLINENANGKPADEYMYDSQAHFQREQSRSRRVGNYSFIPGLAPQGGGEYR